MSTKRPAPDDGDSADSTAHKIPRYTRDSAADFESPPVSVVVGRSRKIFYVHEKHLTSSSDFFKNALNGSWRESSSRIIEMPDCTPDAFKIYVEWLYTARLGKIEINNKYVSENELSSTYFEVRVLRDCYKLGNFLQDVDFRDHLIDAGIQRPGGSVFDEEPLPIYVYRENSTKSPHRSLVVDVAIYTWTKTGSALFQIFASYYPHEFLVDLVSGMSDMLNAGRKSALSIEDFIETRDVCRYHEHTMNKAPYYRVK